jgi:hypothetical protein
MKSKKVETGGYTATITVIENVRSVASGNPDLETNSMFNTYYHNVMIQSSIYNATKCVTTDKLIETIKMMEDQFKLFVDRVKEGKSPSTVDNLLDGIGFK